MANVINYSNASIFTSSRIKEKNVSNSSIFIPPRFRLSGNANIFTGIGKKNLTGNASILAVPRLYVGSSFDEKMELVDISYYRLYNVQNEMGDVEVRLMGIMPEDWENLKEGNFLWVTVGGVILYKYRIEDVERESFGELRFIGYDMSVRAKDVQTTREVYINKQSDQIISELVYSIPGLNLGINDNFGRITVRNEYGSVLNFLNGLTESVSFEWWISQDANDNDFFNIRSERGTGISKKIYYTEHPFANCTSAEYKRDRQSLANVINVLGRGDGINQVSVTTYNASNIYSELAEDIDDIQTEIKLDDASEFASSGQIRISEEVVSYTGKTGNTLTGCVRGDIGTIANYHRRTVFVEPYITIENAEIGSSIKENGLKSETVVARNLIPERYNDINEEIINTTGWSQTAELIASRNLKAKKDIIETITIFPDTYEEDLININVGDTVTVVDPTVGLNKDMIVTEKSYTYDIFSAKEELMFVCATKRFDIMRQLKEEREKSDNINNFMQGATNIYQVNQEDNVDSDFPMFARFFLPSQVRQINRIKLNFKMKNYRADSTSTLSQVPFETTYSIWSAQGLAAYPHRYRDTTRSYITGTTQHLVVTDISVSTGSNYIRNNGSLYAYLPQRFVHDINTSTGSVISWYNTNGNRRFVASDGGNSWYKSSAVTGVSPTWQNSIRSFSWSDLTFPRATRRSVWPLPIWNSFTVPDVSGLFDKHIFEIFISNSQDSSKSFTIEFQELVGGTWTTRWSLPVNLNAWSHNTWKWETTTDYRGSMFRWRLPNFDVNDIDNPDMSSVHCACSTYMTDTAPLNFGIYENTAEFTPPGIVNIDIREEGETWVNVGTFDTDTNNIELKDVLNYEPDKWYEIRLSPEPDTYNGRMRLETSIYVQFFLESN